MTKFPDLTEEAATAIEAMSQRFFLVNRLGRLDRRPDGRLGKFAFHSQAAAHDHAARRAERGVRLYDKAEGRFVEAAR